MATPIPTNHARFTLGEIAEATGGTVVGDPSLVVHGVFLDSRNPQSEGLFVALRGESFDGHKYAADVEAKALLVDRDLGLTRPHVRVDDTQEALGGLAQFHRLRWGGPVVAITGSVGKTTTKEYCNAVLQACGANVCATKGNLNNLVGTPMSVLMLDASTDVGVFEIGTSAPGEIEALAAITLPNVGVVTAVGPSHTEGLGSVEAVATEKLTLAAMLDEGEHAVLNGDSSLIARAATEADVITFGRDETNDVSVAKASLTKVDGAFRRDARFAFRGAQLEVPLANAGHGALGAASAALGVALALSAQGHLHFVPKKAKDALANLPAPASRMDLLEAAGVLWIDDAYNASPLSMVAALDDAQEMAAIQGGRFLAVMGEMGELGALCQSSHVEVLAHAQELGAQTLLFGDAFANIDTSAHTSIDALIDAVRAAEPKAGDVVLLKGSRSMRLERVLEAFGVRGMA
ncbi:MAG: UDP-N-acetylmuramoyl-tripeptide--D-alanyl-D-alanine ligase [Polyangiales bacterium]